MSGTGTKHGAYLGGIRSLECMRQRCVIDAGTGCWHLRRADGRAYGADSERQTVFLHGTGTSTTSTRAAWAFSTGKPVPPDRKVYRRCESHDCINPGHLRCGTVLEQVRHSAKRGAYSSPRQQAAARRAGQTRQKVTPELLRWLLESQQSGCDAAHGLGVAQSRANELRARARRTAITSAASIFSVGTAVNERQFRRQA